MGEIVSRSVQLFAQPSEIAQFVREMIDRGTVEAMFLDADSWAPCTPDAIEEIALTACWPRFVYLFENIKPSYRTDKTKALEEGCHIRLEVPKVDEGTMLMAVIDTKGPPERARLFQRATRVLKKTLSNPTFGFTEAMDTCVPYKTIWHSAGAREFLKANGKWKQFADGTVFFDHREPPGKPARK